MVSSNFIQTETNRNGAVVLLLGIHLPVLCKISGNSFQLLLRSLMIQNRQTILQIRFRINTKSIPTIVSWELYNSML